MSVWWWIPIGLAAWFLVSLAVGLILGPVFRRSAEARKAIERQFPQQGTSLPDEQGREP